MKSVKVYDIETLASLFTYTDIDVNTKEINVFVIHKYRNQCYELIDYIKTKVSGMVGFNSVDFDYPVLHKLIKYVGSFTFNQLIENLNETEIAEHIIEFIYSTAQEIINSQNAKEKDWSNKIREKEFIVPQLDLFRVWHYNNKARSTSLKALEISMNFHNVMDMPIDHSTKNISLSQIDEVCEYNLNDVLATFEFYKKTIDFGKIDLRNKIRRKYNLPCTNWNNGKIGEELILKLYCDKTGKNPWEVKKLRSDFEKIHLKDCVPPRINFITKEFNSVLEAFLNKTVDKSNFEKGNDKKKKKNKVASIIYKGSKIDYGLGGVHGITKPGIYESCDKKVIKTADVASLYPWIPIVYEFYIRHLGPEFLEVYRDNIVNVRLQEKQKPKDQQDKSIIDGFKEAANIPYGKSNDINSFLYDPLYTMKTTVSGQLATSMLAEALGELIPDCELIMFNTDGLEVRIPRQYEQLYFDICKDWENQTKLTLDYDEYSKMWIRDVNNYGCITTEGKIKNKGALEVDKMIGGEPAYHKDNSFKVIAIALQEYFNNNIPVEETVRNHNNIYDFCGRQKFKGQDYGEIHYFINTDSGPELKIEKQQKNTRYYISTNGATFIKQYAKGSREFIHSGNTVTIFNEYIEKQQHEYQIDYQWYIRECNKEIRNIVDNQLSLF